SPECSSHHRAESKSCALANFRGNKNLTPRFNADRSLSILADRSAVWKTHGRRDELSRRSLNQIALRSDFALRLRSRSWQTFWRPPSSRTISKYRVPLTSMAGHQVVSGSRERAAHFRFLNKRPCVILSQLCRSN